MAVSPPSENNQEPSATDETTPLLEAGPSVQSNQESSLLQDTPPSEAEDDTPLPKAQIFLLCYARLVEPIAFFSIFPFVNKMILETGNLDEADVGFYSGLIESLYSLTQMLTMIAWGRAADRLGRKPVLVLTLFGVATATTLFGFSKAIWQMMFCRCLAGFFGGMVVTLRAMISENSTPKTQAIAFSYFTFTSNIGIFLGPFIGGVLSNPADQYPRAFGNIQFFKDYPYALPTIVSGLFSASAAILTTLFVKETLTQDRRAKQKESPMTTWELIKFPGVATVIYIYGHTMLLAFCYTAVIPVFWFTQPSLGGYGFSPFQISMFLGAGGISQALWTLIVFPPLQRRVGTGGVLRACAFAWPFFFAACPIGNVLLRQEWKTAFWIVAPTVNVVGCGVSMAFTAVQLALNDIAPSASTLGTLNALALTVIAAQRAVAPALFTSIFAAGVRTQFLGGYLVWLVMICVAIGLTPAVRRLPAKAEGKIKDPAERG